MDHLPPIVGHQGTPLTVPCVCDPSSFDALQWEAFPTRKGFHLISQDGFPLFILKANRSRLNSQELAEIAQAWLFFGLMIEVLKVSGISVDAEDFVKREGEDNYITMTALPSYLSEWERKENLLPKQTRKAHFRRQQHILIISTMFRLHQMCDRYRHSFLFSSFDRPDRYMVTLPLSIEMSIAILGETLDRGSRKAYGNLDHTPFEPMLQDQILIDELKARGWCPSEISLFLQGLDDTSAFFASQRDKG